VLAERMAPTDTVVMVDAYFFDVPFYARLRHPVVVAGHWDDPDLPKRDNWRKELFDAARFDPALGAKVLRPLAQLDSFACGASAVWFIVPAEAAASVARLGSAARAYANERSELWRVPGRSCP
jgi:hypothetical protein